MNEKMLAQRLLIEASKLSGLDRTTLIAASYYVHKYIEDTQFVLLQSYLDNELKEDYAWFMQDVQREVFGVLDKLFVCRCKFSENKTYIV